MEKDNKKKSSNGGKMVREFLDSGRYVLINETKKVVGGPYTRVDPSCPDRDDKKSVLDLFIVSKELLGFVDTLIVDKNRNFTPYNIDKKKRTVLSPSDLFG